MATHYSVGSAFAQAISMGRAIIDCGSVARVPHIVRIELSGYDIEEAAVYLRDHPARARDKLIVAAAQLLAVAEVLGQPAADNVVAMAGRARLRVVS